MAPPQPSGPPMAAPGLVEPSSTRSARAGLIWAGIAVALAAVLIVVWALGGFAYRQDRLTPVALGTTVAVGPYELTFGPATSQHVSSSNTYEVVVSGTGRTTKDKTISPSTGNDGFIYTKDTRSQEIQTVKQFHFGDSTDVILKADGFTPGLDKVTFTTTFAYTQPVSDELVLVVFDQEFSDHYLFSDNEPTWNRIDTGYTMKVPVKALPERKY